MCKKKKIKKHELILQELKRQLKENHQCINSNNGESSQYMIGCNATLIGMIYFIEKQLK